MLHFYSVFICFNLQCLCKWAHAFISKFKFKYDTNLVCFLFRFPKQLELYQRNQFWSGTRTDIHKRAKCTSWSKWRNSLSGYKMPKKNLNPKRRTRDTIRLLSLRIQKSILSLSLSFTLSSKISSIGSNSKQIMHQIKFNNSNNNHQSLPATI